MKKSSNVVGPDKAYGEPSVKIKTSPLINANTARSNRSVGNRTGKGELLLSLINCSIIVASNGTSKSMSSSRCIAVLINCSFVMPSI